MNYAPFARVINFDLKNLKSYLMLYKPEYNELNRKIVDDSIETDSPRYKKTYSQWMGQFGLEYKEGTNGIFLYQKYLQSYSDDQLNEYIEFWFMTYYSPNSRVNSTEEPEIIYISILEKLLDSENYTLLYDEFSTEFLAHSSDDILENLIINFGKYIIYEKNNKIYLDEKDIEDVKSLIIFIKSEFPIPKANKSEILFFKRYKETNFLKFIDFLYKQKENKIHSPAQVIVYGAPGTGKSHYITTIVNNNTEYIERVTFYDGYSYSQFIGNYKPISKNNDITYEFVPGPIFKILRKAFLNPEEHYYLIIEEINRASADKIFGNIFQLLDRQCDGESKYHISLSEEQDVYLKNQLDLIYDTTISRRNGLYLPGNLSIYATMNSGDQNVYPLDSAFKRRWDFKYITLNENKENFGEKETNYLVEINNHKSITWEKFRTSINNILLKNKIREDRLLAPFFLNPSSFKHTSENNFILSKESFESKILMYLFEDILRYSNKSIIFDPDILSFSDLLIKYRKSKEDNSIFCENFYEELDIILENKDED